jgi:glycosyltransferase involved in cell wall biosynthesis
VPPKVVVYPADRTGCGTIRCIWPTEVLAARGHDVQVFDETDDQRLSGVVNIVDGRKRLVEIVKPDADVVVMQRALSRMWADAVPMLRAEGVRVVVELDDDFKAVSPRNGAYQNVHPRLSPDANWSHLDAAIRECDALVVSTEALARRYGPRAREVHVVPNYVPQRYLEVEGSGRGLGWPGVLGSHPDDFDVANRGIRSAMDSTKSGFHVVGESEGMARVLGVDPARITETGWLPIAGYGHAVAQLDVGVAPLAPTVFNESKSWLKPLELAALGVPVVMSPAAEYVRLHDQHGIGRIARNWREWRGAITALLSDPAQAADEGNLARCAVREQHLTIEEQAGRWWAAWTGQDEAAARSSTASTSAGDRSSP